MLKRAIDLITKNNPDAKVTPVQSNNPHLDAWLIKNPLSSYGFFCAKTIGGKSAPTRQFIAVRRNGQVINSFDGTKFGQLLAAEDKTKWKDDDYRNAAILWVHLLSSPNEDGWKVLEKPEDFTKITFNMDSVGPGVAKQREAAKQIVPLKIEKRDGQVTVEFYAWHLIGGFLRRWEVKVGPKMETIKRELGQFGGGGYD